ncbi:MAG: hypothetical protein M3447_00050 [Acidobacteriota bacterium]|nr:hypothetical protein [Acidobacteriota bacterium]
MASRAALPPQVRGKSLTYRARFSIYSLRGAKPRAFVVGLATAKPLLPPNLTGP